MPPGVGPFHWVLGQPVGYEKLIRSVVTCTNSVVPRIAGVVNAGVEGGRAPVVSHATSNKAAKAIATVWAGGNERDLRHGCIGHQTLLAPARPASTRNEITIV